jgi:hypothetical protein
VSQSGQAAMQQMGGVGNKGGVSTSADKESQNYAKLWLGDGDDSSDPPGAPVAPNGHYNPHPLGDSYRPGKTGVRKPG